MATLPNPNSASSASISAQRMALGSVADRARNRDVLEAASFFLKLPPAHRDHALNLKFATWLGSLLPEFKADLARDETLQELIMLHLARYSRIQLFHQIADELHVVVEGTVVFLVRNVSIHRIARRASRLSLAPSVMPSFSELAGPGTLIGEEALRKGMLYDFSALAQADGTEQVVDDDDGSAIQKAVVVWSIPKSQYLRLLSDRHSERVSINARVEFLLAMHVFQGWRPRDLLPVALKMTLHDLSAPAFVYREGEPFRGVFAVSAGDVVTCTSLDLEADDSANTDVEPFELGGRRTTPFLRRKVDFERMGMFTLLGDTELVNHSAVWLSSATVDADKAEVFFIPTVQQNTTSGLDT